MDLNNAHDLGLEENLQGRILPKIEVLPKGGSVGGHFFVKADSKEFYLLDKANLVILVRL